MVFGEKVEDIMKRYPPELTVAKFTIKSIKDIAIIAIILTIVMFEVIPVRKVDKEVKYWDWKNVGIIVLIVVVLVGISRMIEWMYP